MGQGVTEPSSSQKSDVLSDVWLKPVDVLEANRYVLFCFFQDFSKACDSLFHSMPLDEMPSTQLDKTIICWVSS